MNIIAKTSILAVTGLVLASQAADAALQYTAGDILLGFRTSSKEYVIDLGNFSNFTPTSTFSLDISADLASLAANWNTGNTGITWSVMGYAGSFSGNNASALTNNYSIFASKGEQTLGTPETSYNNLDKTTAVAIKNSIIGFTGNAVTGPNVADGAAARSILNTPSGIASDWTYYVTGATTNGVPFNGLPSSPETNLDTAGFTATTLNNTAVDLFKMNASASGAGVYEGTFQVSNAGVLSYQAVPEPSTYAMLCVGALGVMTMLRRRAIKA